MDKIKTEVCSFKELYKAMNKCKQNVMWKASISGYVKMDYQTVITYIIN